MFAITEVLVRETNPMEQRRLAHSASDLWVQSLPFGPIPLPAGTFQVSGAPLSSPPGLKGGIV